MGQGVVDGGAFAEAQGGSPPCGAGPFRIASIAPLQTSSTCGSVESSTKGAATCVAGGVGLAPIKALVEHMQHMKSERPVRFYWGGRRPQDLYMHALCQEWAEQLPNFTYVPVVSDALPEDGWNGRTGYVHQAVVQDLPDLSGWQVYACGAPIVVESAQRDFTTRCQLPADEFYADSFTTEADLAKP